MKNKIKKMALSTMSGAVIASNIPLNIFADILEGGDETQISRVEDVLNSEINENELLNDNLSNEPIISETNDTSVGSNEVNMQPSSGEVVDKEQVVVRIKDAALEGMIRGVLGKQTGDITQADMEKIKYLEATELGISDLTGLEYAVNLRVLTLTNNEVGDISPLKGLNNLEQLDLSGNQVSDISSLAGLSRLEMLFLHNNQISNISALSEMTLLEYLFLNDNQITDVSSLEKVTNLTSLDLTNNKIDDLAGLKNNTRLQSLYLNGNKGIKMSDVEEVLSKNQNLEFLGLSVNGELDLTPFDLWYLDLTNSVIKKPSDLILGKVSDIHIGESELHTLDFLKDASSLYQIAIWDTEISDYSVLNKIDSLDSVQLINNNISDLSPFRALQDNWVDVNLYNQHVELGTVLAGNKINNPFIDLDGSYITDIDLPDGVSLSEDGSELIFNDGLSNGSYHFTARSCQLRKVAEPREGGDVEISHECDNEDMASTELNATITVKTEQSENENPEVNEPEVEQPGIDKPIEDDKEEDIEKPTITENNAPVIIGSNVSIPVGYELDLKKLVTATDEEDGELEADILSSNFNHKVSGTYHVTYTATDSKGLTTEKTIQIVVRGSLEEKGGYTKDVVIKPNEKLDIESIVDEVAKDKGLTDIEIIENNVDTTKPGDYKVIFEGTNSKKEQEIHSIKVTVATQEADESVETGLTSGGLFTLGGLLIVAGIPFLRRESE